MKTKKVLPIFIAITVLLFVFAGCGGPKEPRGGEAEYVPPVAETVEQNVAEQITETVDKAVGDEELLGSWVGAYDDTLVANISKNGDEYEFEDNDGKYKGTFVDGILKVAVSDQEGDTADVYINKENGNLVLVYMENIIEYARK